MSLVAYDASSDEDSDSNDEETTKAIIIDKPLAKANTNNEEKVANGHISDEDDEYIPTIEEPVLNNVSSFSRLLPKPKNETNLAEILENFAKPTFTALPTPKTVSKPVAIVEEDDEFLHKKVPIEIIEKPQARTDNKKMPVQITIPSLRNFSDVDKEMAEKAKNKATMSHTKPQGTSGLLSMLPKAKSEQNFAKPSTTTTAADSNSNKTTNKPYMPAFVPDTVKHRRPATNTEEVDRLKPLTKKKISNLKPNKKESDKTNENADESGDDDDDNTTHTTGDFFSFNTDQSLPEVSATEINALVAKKAAKMAETTTKFLNATEKQETNAMAEHEEMDQQELEASRKRYHQEQQLNPEALQALVGGSGTKRRRQHKEDIQVIDINSEQVLPNRDEWMRSALASSTTYQPTGVLVDEEPASGTRRKHQITYLAHKAKANEAELQAMWSANRQNRRATQNKYGF